MLFTFFREEREAGERRIREPLVAAMTSLLRIMFPGADLLLARDEKGGDRLEVRRGAAVDTFEGLSYGAREQIGVIVRLALAQVLASSFGGTLPVVLDDPLVNADAARQEQMVRVLHHVSRTGGLQVIVLTCDPARYQGLGLRPDQRVDLPVARGLAGAGA
jgi:wobble nucleotide-excising tRNase